MTTRGVFAGASVETEDTPDSGADPEKPMLLKQAEKHRELIKRVCREMLSHEQKAEDACSEVFVRLSNASVTFVNDMAFKGWLCTVARRICLDELRRESRQKGISLDENALATTLISPDDGDPQAVLFKKESDEMVRQVIRELEPLHQRVLIARFYDEMSPAQIADEMGKDVKWVYNAVERAKGKLRQRLKQHLAAYDEDADTL